MHQLVKLSDAIWLLQLAISSLLIHALGDLSQAPTAQGFEPGSSDWKADDLPTELSLLPDEYYRYTHGRWNWVQTDIHMGGGTGSKLIYTWELEQGPNW